MWNNHDFMEIQIAAQNRKDNLRHILGSCGDTQSR